MSDAVRLLITEDHVRLYTETGEQVATEPVGSITRYVDDLVWRLGQARRGGSSAEVAHRLHRLGEALGETFLPGLVGAELRRLIENGARVRVAVETYNSALGDLPWEAVVVPGRERPLALEDRVEIYRLVSESDWESHRAVPRGPLRILVLLAAPAGGRPLNLQAELASIHDAVRHSDGHVRLISPGTLDALSEALNIEPVHVVHLACHAIPGAVLLEDDAGNETRVGAEELALVLRGVPLVVLAGCFTAVGDMDLSGVAHRLVVAGVPAVVAMSAQVSDGFSPRLAGRVYRMLATEAEPEPLTVLSTVRREIEAERLNATGAGLAELAEWATPILLLSTASRPLFRLAEGIDSPLTEASTFRGLIAGRQQELRLLKHAYGAHPIMVLDGLPGIGKSRLAREAAERLRAGGTAIVLSGVVDADQLIFAQRPAVLLLDGFEPNLRRRPDSRHEVRDQLVASALADLTHGEAPVIVLATSCVAFLLGHKIDVQVANFQVPLLDAAGTAAMLFQLPTLSGLPDRHRIAAVQAVGGHPGVLEDLEMRLAAGGDVTAALAETIAAAATRCGLPDYVATLDPTALSLLLHIAVHRTTVRSSAMVPIVDEMPAADYVDALGRLIADGFVIRSVVTSAGAEMVTSPAWLTTALEPVVDKTMMRDAHRHAAYLYEYELQAVREGPAPDEATLQREVFLLIEARWHHKRAGDSAYAGTATNRLVKIWSASADPWRVEQLLQEELANAAPDSHDAAASHQSLAAIASEHREFEIAIEHLTIALGTYELLGDTVRMAEVHHGLAAVEDRRGNVKRVVAECEAALALVADGQAPHVVASCHNTLGNLAAQRGDRSYMDHYARAITEFQAASQDRYRASLALVYLNRARTAARAGDHQSAMEDIREATRVVHPQDDQNMLVTILQDLAIIAQLQGDPSTAQRYLRQAVEISEAAGDLAETISQYHELGILAADRGDLDGAETYHRRSLLGAQELGDGPAVARSHHELALVSMARGDFRGARTLAERAVTLTHAAGDDVAAAIVHGLLGEILSALDQPDEALTHLLTATELSLQYDLIDVIPTVHHYLGDLAMRQERYDDAAAAYEQAVAANRRRSRPESLMHSLVELAFAYFTAGLWDESERVYTEIVEEASALGSHTNRAQAHNQLGVLALRSGQTAIARDHFTKSLADAEAAGDDANAAGVVHNLGEAALLGGDHDDALAYFTRAQAMYRELHDSGRAVYQYYEFGQVHLARGDLDQAEANFEQYALASKELGVDRAYVEGLVALVGVRMARDDARTAAELAFTAFILAMNERYPEAAAALDALMSVCDRFGETAIREVILESFGSRAATAFDQAMTFHSSRLV